MSRPKGDDLQTLRKIAATLGIVGSQLDAADHLRDHNPWSAIAKLQTEFQQLAASLSDRFGLAHPGLLKRLNASSNLHLIWSDLIDEVKQAIQYEQELGVIPVGSGDPEMDAAIQQARDSLPRFMEMLTSPAPGQTCFGLKARFPVQGAAGEHEHIWLSDVRQLEDHFAARIANHPQRLDYLQLYDLITVYPDDVTDWIIIQNGELLGGYTVRVLRDRMSARERQQLEARAGVTIPEK
jgi:uncharacterized protein YegJ (DUF2314 family)